MSSRDKVYDINVRRLALMTLPTIWRRPLMGALVYAAVSPIASLFGGLRGFRREKGYRLTHNSQVCLLRGVLNDEFDPGLRRIRIADPVSAVSTEAAHLWRREEGRWVHLPRRGNGSSVIYRRGYGGIGGYDFWVTIPAELRGDVDETRLRAIVDTYRLASKRYAVNYI